VAVRISGKGSDHCFANRDQMHARPYKTNALAAHASAFEQQRQCVRKHIRLSNPGAAAELRQAIALPQLEFFDDVPSWMVGFGKFNRHICHIAASGILTDAFGAGTNPGMELGQRFTGIILFEFAPYCIGFAGDVAETGDHQIILGAEMTIKRHLVGIGSVGNRIDTDSAYPMPAKQIPRSGNDALARSRRVSAAACHSSESLCHFCVAKSVANALDSM
jgi:hypothetical protein